MTRSISKRPLHRRLSTGWRDFCISIGVQVGDTLTYSQGRHLNELRVRVERAEGKSLREMKTKAAIPDF